MRWPESDPTEFLISLEKNTDRATADIAKKLLKTVVELKLEANRLVTRRGKGETTRLQRIVFVDCEPPIPLFRTNDRGLLQFFVWPEKRSKGSLAEFAAFASPHVLNELADKLCALGGVRHDMRITFKYPWLRGASISEFIDIVSWMIKRIEAT